MRIHHLRTFLRTNRVTGALVRWGWRHYLTALAYARPNDCAGIPKVAGAGEVFTTDPDTGEPCTPFQMMHNGVRVGLDGYYSNLFTEIIRVLRGHHEPQEERVFHEVLDTLPDDAVMIEAGGYWAYYSMWLKKAKPRARNIIIEPVDDHLALGKSNFKLNGMTAEFVRAYIGETSAPPREMKLEGVKVPALERVCIDDVLERNRVPFAHVIHGDVQGAELDLLHGAAKTIEQSRVGYFFLSTHGDALHAECRKFLVDRGYVIVTEHTRKESFTTDGLIVARNPAYPGLNRVRIHHNTGRASPMVVLKYLLRRGGRAKAAV